MSHPAHPVEVGRRERERLVPVRTWAIAAPLEERDVAQPRGKRRAVQQVPGVEEQREDDDRQPRQPGRDALGPLRRTGRRPRTRSRSSRTPRGGNSPRPSRRARTPTRSRSRGRDARGIEQEPPGRPAGRRSPGLPKERLRRRSRRRRRTRRAARRHSRRRGAGPGSRRYFQTHQRSFASTKWTRPRACRRGLRERRRGDACAARSDSDSLVYG